MRRSRRTALDILVEVGEGIGGVGVELAVEVDVGHSHTGSQGMEGFDNGLSICGSVELGECFGIVEEHVGISELDGGGGALIFGVEASGVVDLHMLEQRVAGDVVVVGRGSDQRRDGVGIGVGAHHLSGSGYGLSQPGSRTVGRSS